MMKWAISAGVAFAALIVGISFYLQPTDFAGCGNKPSTVTHCEVADAIVVVSGGDTAARTDAGITLYKNGWAGVLILSGAALDKSGPSNAAAMRDQALRQGVPSDAILIDETSSNTQENAKNTQSIFAKYQMKDIILVTSGYHQRRANLEFQKETSGVTVRNFPITDRDWHFWWWLTPRGWWLATAELVKIIAFHLGVSS